MGGHISISKRWDSAATKKYPPNAGQTAILSQGRSMKDLLQSHEEVSFSAICLL